MTPETPDTPDEPTTSDEAEALLGTAYPPDADEDTDPEPASSDDADEATPAAPVAQLARGHRGPQVVDLQQALRRAGQLVRVDGRFGKRTAAAVAAFQSEHGLEPTGSVDEATAAALS